MSLFVELIFHLTLTSSRQCTQPGSSPHIDQAGAEVKGRVPICHRWCSCRRGRHGDAAKGWYR